MTTTTGDVAGAVRRGLTAGRDRVGSCLVSGKSAAGSALLKLRRSKGSSSRKPKVADVPYSTFYHSLRTGRVESVRFDDNSPKIYFSLAPAGNQRQGKGEKARWFYTKRVPSDASLLPLLIQKRVVFGTRSSVSSSIGKVVATALLLWLPLLPLFLFLRRQIQQQQGMSKSNSKRRNARNAKGGPNSRVPEVTFKDVAGADYAIAELREIVDFLHYKQEYLERQRREKARRRGGSKYATAFLGSLNVVRTVRIIADLVRRRGNKAGTAEAMGMASEGGEEGARGDNGGLKKFIRMPRGVLLSGPPGTGKTLLAKAVAGEASVPFFACSASEFVELFVGRGAARVRDLFKQARASAPSIVFIDEIDALGAKRGTGFNEERDQTLNQLLTELDGFGEGGRSNGAAREDAVGPNVLLMCATNRPEVLDQALLRPGRLTRKVEISLPDEKGRKDIALVYLRGMPLEQLPMQPPGSDQSQLEQAYSQLIAAGTGGCSGADIANVVNEAVLMATRRSSDLVTCEDILQGVQRTRSPIKSAGSANAIVSALESMGLPNFSKVFGDQTKVVRAQQRMP